MGISKTVLEEIRQKYADGMLMHEIAKRFNIPESTVRNIIMRGDDQKTKEQTQTGLGQFAQGLYFLYGNAWEPRHLNSQ